MAMWSPFRGCHKYSEGCRYCYIHKGDNRRGTDTSVIVKNDRNFAAPLEKNKKGEYKIKAGQTVYVCFSSDFLIEEADRWRQECWDIIRERGDLSFIFLTKRIDRFFKCAPPDWGQGYENVRIGVSVENQKQADYRLSIFSELPVKHKNIICQPLIERIDIEKYLSGTELVIVGGESDKDARPLDFDWVLDIRDQCKRMEVPQFQFRQCGTNFIKDGQTFKLNLFQLCAQAKKAGIDY